MLKVEAIVDGKQLETLLLAARAVGVKLELAGVVLDELPSPRRKFRQKERSTKRKSSRPKRYKANMQVKLGPEPTEGPPQLIKLHRALRKTYGDETFRKGDVKAAMRSKFNGTPGLMTRLLDQGSVLPAERT